MHKAATPSPPSPAGHVGNLPTLSPTQTRVNLRRASTAPLAAEGRRALHSNGLSPAARPEVALPSSFVPPWARRRRSLKKQESNTSLTSQCSENRFNSPWREDSIRNINGVRYSTHGTQLGYEARTVLRGCGPCRAVFSAAVHSTVFALCSPLKICISLCIFVVSFIGMSVVGALPATQNVTVASSDLYDLDELSELQHFLNGLLAFLLALYVSNAVARWWEMRNACVGVLWDSIDRLSMWAAAWMSTGTVADTAARALILRYGLLSHALLFKHARGQLHQSTDVVEAGLSDLVDLKLLKMPEAEKLAPLYGKAHVVWAWQAAFWTCALSQHASSGQNPTTSKEAHAATPSNRPKPIPHAEHLMPLVMESCARARDAISIGLTYVSTQQPFAYVHMLALSVWIATVINALLAGLKLAYLDPKLLAGGFALPQPSSWPLVLACVARLVFLPVMYDGLLGLAITLENPFAESAAGSGFPSEMYEHDIHAECSAMAMGVDSIDPSWWQSTGRSHLGSIGERSAMGEASQTRKAAQEEWCFGPKTRLQSRCKGSTAPRDTVLRSRARMIARIGTLSRITTAEPMGTATVVPLSRLPESPDTQSLRLSARLRLPHEQHEARELTTHVAPPCPRACSTAQLSRAASTGDVNQSLSFKRDADPTPPTAA